MITRPISSFFVPTVHRTTDPDVLSSFFVRAKTRTTSHQPNPALPTTPDNPRKPLYGQYRASADHPLVLQPQKKTRHPRCSPHQKGPTAAMRPEKSKRDSASRKHLTIAEVCEELDIARSTFYDWRAKKAAPRCIRLPNGDIRVRRSDLESWLTTLEEAA